MKKKVLTIIGAVLLCIGAQAQIVSTRSSIVRTEKQPSEKQWYVRGGLNMMKFTGDGADEASGKAGYNLTFGYQKPMGSFGMYWGMEFGLGSRGYKYEESYSGYEIEDSYIAHNFQYSPFTFGYKYNVTEDIAIDAHLGAYASIDYLGKNKYKESYKGDSDETSTNIGDWTDWKRYDAGMNIGVGVWYKRYNFDLTYQRGFIKTWECNTSNFMVRLGVAF